MTNKEFINSIKKTFEARLEDNSAKNYISRLNNLAKHYPNKKLTEMTSDDINVYLSFLKKTKKLRPSSIRAASEVFNFTYNGCLKKEFPIDKHSMPWKDKVEVHIPTQEDLIKIFKEVGKVESRTALEFLYGTGVEVSEMLTIKVRDIDFKNNIVRVQLNRKGGTRKTILPEKLKNQIKELCKGKKIDSFVFSIDGMKAFHVTTIQKAFKKAVTIYGSKTEYNLRSLRHAYIKHMEANQVHLMSIMSHLGLSEEAALRYLNQTSVIKTEITFSPLDRRIIEKKEINKAPYVSYTRIQEIESIESKDFDLKKLCQFLREINCAYDQDQLLTIAILLRAIIDHVPPIFKFDTFKEVANNYSGYGRSFKEHMTHLEKSTRKVADSILHQTIRKKEDLPKPQQVDFKAALDQLLQEILTILRD